MPIDRNVPVKTGNGTNLSHFNDQVEPVEAVPGFGETIAASFRTESEIGSLSASEVTNLSGAEFRRVDPGFNPYEEGYLEGYEDHADQFVDAHNTVVGDAIKADIDRETRDRETVEAAGWAGVGTDLIASVVSPTSLLPGGAYVKAGRVGYSVGRTALVVGAANAGAASVQEGALQASQQTRTTEESVLSVGGSFVLGSILGAAGSAVLGGAEFKRLSRALEDDLAGEFENPQVYSDQIIQKLKSAGSAASDENLNFDDLEIGGPRAVKAIAAATSAIRLNPGVSLLTSPSGKVKEAFLRGFENHVGTAGELEGRSLGPAAETNTRYWRNGALSVFTNEMKGHWKQARKAGFQGRRKDFNVRVSHASRRGYVDPQGDPYVTAAAEAVRKTILDPLKDEAVEVGLLDRFVKVQTAPSYLHRLYNKRRIISEEGRFRGVVGTWVRGEVQRAVAKQEQVGIARDINRANDLNDQLNSALGRLDSVTTRVAGRQEVRSRKLDLIRKAEGDRFDALSGRVPSYVIEAAKAAKDDDTMICAVAEVSKATKTRKRPLLDLLRSRGGVRVGSPLDGEMRAMGITPKTAPGLFRREEGLAAVDNLPASEDLWLAQLPTDQNGYAEPDAILAALRDEAAGSPIRTPDELADETARDVLSQNVEEWLRGIGLREDASAKEVREYLSQAVANDGRLSALDQKIGRMNGELEEFDRLTDEVVNQKLIVEAEAGKYADELNKLEEKINAVRDLANNSPAVSLMVDYADTRKAYARARYDQARLGNRIEAIERVSSEGRASAELEDELRALRSDKNKADERVIKARQKSEKLKPMLPKDKGDELDFSDQTDLEAYADTIVDGIFDNITGKTVEDTPEWMVPVAQGPLKGRTFNIPDEMIEDFLENDIELVTQQYVKKMSAEVELTRAFGRADMRDQIDGIKAEYRGLRAAAKTEKERIKLDASETRDITHLEAFRDILRGTYQTGSEGSGWSAMTRLALSWNFITALGGVTLSSLPDAFSVLTKSGLRSVVRDGLPALTSKTQAIRIAKRDAFESGAISSTALNSRLAELAELNDPYASGSQAERIMNNVTAAFSKATFLDHWNDLMKTIVAVQTQQKVSRLLLNSLEDIPVPSGLSRTGGKQAAFGKLSKYERGYLGKLGIDEVMGARIAAQVKSFGLQEDGIWGLNLNRWSDKSAARVMRGAINKEADGVVITPGIADKPLWARTNTGKLILQFRSFGLAAHQRLLLSRLQGNPKHLAEFALFGTLGGMMVSYLKLLERGDYEGAERLTQNPGLWVSDGFDRTGIASVLMDVSNTAEKVGAPFGIRTAAQLAVGDQDLSANVSRFASRNAAGALLGPSIGRLQDMATIASQLSNGEVNGQGARAIVRNVPGATLPGARTFFETQVKPALVNAVD